MDSSSSSCSNWGTRVWALDIDVFPLFTELLDLLRVERRVWTIRPYEPLPDLGRKFDLITAFSIDFNRESKRDWWWGPAEWAFFLDDLKRHLNPGGRIFLGLNPREDGEYYTAELREFFLSSGCFGRKGKRCLVRRTSRSLVDGAPGMK